MINKSAGNMHIKSPRLGRHNPGSHDSATPSQATILAFNHSIHAHNLPSSAEVSTRR
jgi:hypothetical protein